MSEWTEQRRARLRDRQAGLTYEAGRAAALAVLNALWKADSAHHFHGNTCLCGYASDRARSRTEHITDMAREALDALDTTREDQTHD